MNNLPVSYQRLAAKVLPAVDPKPATLLLLIFVVWLSLASPALGVDADFGVTSFSNFLPSTMAAGSRPTNMTYSLVNFGPGSLGNNSGGTGPVLIELWISPNASFGDADDRSLGQMQFSISAPAGSSGTYSHSNPNGLSGFTIPLDAAGAYRVFIRVLPAPSSGMADPTWANNLNLLPATLTVSGGGAPRPTVTSIIRWNPPFQTNNAQFVTWLVSFSETVTGVDLNDFTLVDVGGTVAGEFLGNVSAGGGSQVQVTANTGFGGAGDLRLDVNYPGATIVGLAGNALTNSFTSGQVYSVDKISPTVVSINRLQPLSQITSATTVVYRVTFSEPVISLGTEDFILTDISGNLQDESVTSVSASIGAIIDVTVNTGSVGDGELRLDALVPSASFSDLAGNGVMASFVGGQTYIIDRHFALPIITVSDASTSEGQSGIRLCEFQISLSSPSSVPVSVNFATANGTAAAAENDYTPTNGPIVFSPGESAKTITVEVLGDTQVEADETFFIQLANATNAIIANAQATGTILNDDTPVVCGWQNVFVSDLPAGTQLGAVWARNRTEVFVCANRQAGGVWSASVYRWDGAVWAKVLDAPANYSGSIYGVGEAEVFFSSENGIWRSTDHGQTWTPQTLPPGLGPFAKLSGTVDNVQVIGGSGIVRFDGTSWSRIRNDIIYTLHVPTPDEGHFVTCSARGDWNGSEWTRLNQFTFCDVKDTWWIRDGSGSLHWYAVGNNGGANGIKVWKFDESSGSFGCASCYAFSAGSGNNVGSAIKVWGSAADDVYVIGDLAATSGGPRAGKLYHFDGEGWSEVTEIGPISEPQGLHGTARDDVWVSLRFEAKLLHYAPAATPALSISQTATGVLVSWPNSVLGFRLEATPNLSPSGSWSSITNSPTRIGGQYQLTLPRTNGNQFFRLVNP